MNWPTIINLLYPSSSFSELAALGPTEISQRFEQIKAQIRAKLDGSPESELKAIQAQIKLIAELENAILTKLADKPAVPMQRS